MKFIPNIVTLIRILIIPWIPYVYLKLNLTWLALILVILAALTDFLDGFIARRFHATSLLGQVLDPLADKLFLIVIIYTLFTTDALPQSFVFPFVGIELLFMLVAGFFWIYDKSYLVKAQPVGKIATALFFLLSILSFTPIEGQYLIPGFYVILLLKVISTFTYGSYLIREIQRRKIETNRRQDAKVRKSVKDPD